MADKTPGRVAYEKYAQVFAGTRTLVPWGQLRPPVRGRWEAVASAVTTERQRRNVVITACTDPGCGGDCGG